MKVLKGYKKPLSSYKTARFLFLLIFVFSFFYIANTNLVIAVSVDEINQKIEDKKKIIDQLNRDIKQKQEEINKVSNEAKTLQGNIQVLDLSKKNIETNIVQTQTKIQKASLTIDKLSIEIQELSRQEKNSREAIGGSIKSIYEQKNESILENFLSNRSIAQSMNKIFDQNKLTESLHQHVEAIIAIREDLKEKYQGVFTQKQELLGLEKNLSGQKKAVEATKQEKAKILQQTKNTEAEYQRILNQKIAQREAFEKELFEFESQLKIALDPKSFASSKPGILSWPLDSVRITQLFGRTADAKRLYVSGTHNGIDFAASDGTPIKSALNGVVEATGNTDVGACYSYGKWILLKHDNGISTLYAHLSSINISKGESVSTGEIIGYSGRTGYVTGPHLHFTVYATQGMRVEQYVNSINCKNVTIPIADPKAYLDPMQYLPGL
jgi:murein DD-endopeptidase MepM/ murein hydrolase activator NlpD